MGTVEIGTLRRTAGYDKKRLTGYNPARRYLVCFAFCLHGIVHLLGYKSPLPGIGFFWQVNSCRIMSKLFSLHGGSLLKPPLHSAQGRHPHKGKRNSGLDLFKAAAIRAWIISAGRRLFFFCRRPADDRALWFGVIQCFYFRNQIIIGFAAKNAAIKFCLLFKQVIVAARHKQERNGDPLLTNIFK